VAEEHVNVAVVGGGVAGLYCCFHLREHYSSEHPDWTLALYEASDRLGGKIETWRIDPKTIDGKDAAPIKIRQMIADDEGLTKKPAPVANLSKSKNKATAAGIEPQQTKQDARFEAAPKPLQDLFVAEFGPMRIEPDHQPYLGELLHQLGIEPEGDQPKWSDLVPFSPYRGEPPTEPRFTLEGEEADQATLIDLLLLALRRVCETLSFNNVKDDAPWRLKNPSDGTKSTPYDDANFFWREFKQEQFLHRRYWKRSLRQWINLLNEDHYEFIRESATFRGTLLRNMGFWNLLGAVLSHMATVKIRDWASFYHLLPENPSAAEWLIFWLRAIKSTDALRGIRGGMDWIVHALCQRLEFVIEQEETHDRIYPIYKHSDQKVKKPAVKFHHSRKLIRVEECEREGSEKCVRLTFRDMSHGGGRLCRITADHVILSIPKSALQDIDLRCDDRTSEALKILFDSVSGIPLLKCFFVVKDPFWEDNRPASRYAHTAPTRELHYWKSRDNTRGMMMVYTDRPGTQFWCDYLVDDLQVNLAGVYGLGAHKELMAVRRDRPTATIWSWMPDQGLAAGWMGEKFGNDRLLRTFLSYSREDGAESITAERLLAAGMHDWGLKPYEGACHAWRPGSDPKKIMDYFRGFALTKGGAERLHICGEAYSDYQGFIEGALRSAAEMLVLKFKLPRPLLTGRKDDAPRLLARTIRVPPEEAAQLKLLELQPVEPPAGPKQRASAREKPSRTRADA
jgi:monoamine oxidase